MIGSAIYYFTNTADVVLEFTELGYPVYTMWFNAVSKLIGGAAILFSTSKVLKEWAYAGYLFILLLAMYSKLAAGKTVEGWFMLVFIVIWALAYWQYHIQKR
jgi:hypothetical protein